MFKKTPRTRRSGRLQKADPWPKCFSEYREDVKGSFVDSWAEVAVDRSLIEYFLQPKMGALPSIPLELARAFLCSDTQESSSQDPPSREWVWRGGRHTGRCFCGPGDATNMCFGCALEQLGQDRCYTRQDEVSRSLICVLNFTKTHGRDLIQNVSEKGADTLRSAILGHLARSTVLRVDIPDEGYETFCLELHLPFFAVCKHQVTQSDIERSGGVAQKAWEDTSFLRADVENASGDSCCLIYKAHATISISGSNCLRYKGYSFLDLGYLPADIDDEVEDGMSDNDDDDGEDLDADVEDPLIDVFATHGDGRESVILARQHPLEPRAYFLECVKSRGAVVKGHYEYIVAHLEIEVQAWIDRNIMTACKEGKLPASQTLNNELKFEYLHRAKRIIDGLRGEMKETLRVWANFSHRSGHIKFFVSLQDESKASSMRDLAQVYTDIQGLEQRLKRLGGCCEGPLKLLRYKVALNNSALNQHNNVMTDQTLGIQSKAIALSTKSTQFASESLKAAESATKMSRVSICLYLLTTSFISALQYFTSDQNIFALSRTPRMFFIAIGVLIPLFIAVSWLMYFVDGYKMIVFWRLYVWMGGSKRPNKGETSDTGTAQNESLDEVNEL